MKAELYFLLSGCRCINLQASARLAGTVSRQQLTCASRKLQCHYYNVFSARVQTKLYFSQDEGANVLEHLV